MQKDMTNLNISSAFKTTQIHWRNFTMSEQLKLDENKAHRDTESRTNGNFILHFMLKIIYNYYIN